MDKVPEEAKRYLNKEANLWTASHQQGDPRTCTHFPGLAKQFDERSCAWCKLVFQGCSDVWVPEYISGKKPEPREFVCYTCVLDLSDAWVHQVFSCKECKPKSRHCRECFEMKHKLQECACCGALVCTECLKGGEVCVSCLQQDEEDDELFVEFGSTDE